MKQEVLVFGGIGMWKPVSVLKMQRQPVFSTEHGVLFQGDCCEVLREVYDGVVDTVFADPPFNIGKKYGNLVDDSRPDDQYVDWCKTWINECIRVLKPGGAFFIYNIPKWNVILGNYMMEQNLTFRNWIAISLTACPPIPNRLYPSHYSLLYFTKGAGRTYRRIRTPIRVCRHCGKDIKDYGGYRDTMDPNGVNLTDVWDDIPPVRHKKYKSTNRKANQLSTKLVRRCIEISTRAGDLVLDPFGGAGTTFDVCETTRRYWIGIELLDCDVIVERLTNPEICHHKYDDYVEMDDSKVPNLAASSESGRTKSRQWKGSGKLHEG